MKNLGDAAGSATLEIISRHFSIAKSANERIYSKEDLERIEKLKNAYDNTDAIWKDAFQKAGRQLVPLEFRVRQTNGNSSIDFRFIFPASLTAHDFTIAILKLSNEKESLFRKLEKDYEGIRQLLHTSEFVPKIEAVFDKNTGEWMSFPASRANLKAISKKPG